MLARLARVATVAVVGVVLGFSAISGTISDGADGSVVGDSGNDILARVASSYPSHKIELAYSYSGKAPISMSLTVPDRGTADTAKGEMISFKSYANGRASDDPLFLGFRVVAKHVRSNKNNFIWLSMEFNKLTGAVSSPLNMVRVNVNKISRINDPRRRMRYLKSKKLIDFPTPILSEESGVFYLPVKIGRDIVNYKRGNLSLKIRIRESR